MDSALRPRDIQVRIRAGESPADVAAAAGVPVERIDAFAAPVLAERDHIAGLARTHPVRRRGETASHRPLRVAVAEHLQPRGVDAATIVWDAWKLEDRSWRVRARFESDGEHVADFTYDQAGRFCVPANDEARLLVGDLPPVSEGSPADDQLALVRALQRPSEDEADATAEPVPVATVTPLPTGAVEPAGDVEPVESEESVPPVAAGGTEHDLDDAYFEAELTEVDGVLEIVPASDSDLDVLYDMLSSFDEDSVKIYAGLVHPIQDSLPVVDVDPAAAEALPAEPAATEPDVAAEDQTPDQTPAPADAPPPSPQEPEQLSLIDDEVAPASPQRPRPRRKRASVPSWDEIVFGGPTSPKPGE